MSHIIDEIKQFSTYTKDYGTTIRRKLIAYWIVMRLAVFSAIMVILSITGVFSHSDKRLNEALDLQQQNTMDSLEDHMGQLSARCVDLSERISAELSSSLFLKGKILEMLNDDQDLIVDLEERMYPLIDTTLRYSECSGVFFMLDATCDTKAENARYSRMGIYLRNADLRELNTVNKHMAYFRGDSEVAGKEEIAIHEQWTQEFDTAMIPEYDRMMEESVSDLEDCCRWAGRLKLKGTEEEVMLLCDPILDASGQVCGICGIEISELYFRLANPVYDSSYGSMLTIVAPMEGNTLNLEHAVFGSCGDIFLRREGALTVKKEKYYNIYSSGEEEYIGLHGPLSGKSLNGKNMVAVTLLSENYFNKVVSGERRLWIIGSVLFFFIMLFIAWFLTTHFVAPIYKVLANIREDRPIDEYHSGITELDDLAEYIQNKAKENEQRELPPNIEVLFQEFSEKVAKLTPMERTVLQFYIDGYTIEEVAVRAFISVNTVKKHNTNINRKLEVSNREELMLYIDLFRRSGRIGEITYHSEL